MRMRHNSSSFHYSGVYDVLITSNKHTPTESMFTLLVTHHFISMTVKHMDRCSSLTAATHIKKIYEPLSSGNDSPLN